RINGAGDVLDTAGTTAEVPGVERGGRYRLTVTFTDLQCSNTAEVIVRDDRILPNSILPTQIPLECDGSPTVVSIGPAEDGIDYRWTRTGETMVLGTDPDLTVTELGSYVASLTNPTSGCTRMDTIEVIASVGIPTITAPPGPITMPCNPDTLTLAPGYANVDQFSTYVWTTTSGRIVITDVDNATPRVVLPGTYQVRVGNGACQDSLSIIVEPPVLPTVNAGDDSEILCQQTFQLEGDANTTTGGDINYQWTIGGVDVPMGAAASVVVDQPGTYYLAATDATTGCVATDSVVLSAPSGFPVYELPDTIGGLGCSGDMINIRVSNPADDYEYAWSDPEGNDISTSVGASVSMVGFHTVVITNPNTNCQATDQVYVDDDAAELPFVAFRRNSLDITCESVPVIINAEPSVDGPEYLYTWSTVTDGEEPSEQGNDSLAVRTAGTYRLTVLNQQTNCEAFRDIVVTDSRVYPQITDLQGETLDCDTRETVIGVNILDQPNNYNIQWAGPIGVEDLPQDTNRLVVTVGGTYNAVVINPESSCVTTATFRVEDLIDSIATLAIMAPDSFDCNNETVTIDASATDLNASGSDGISWTSFNGNTINPSTGSLIVSVDGAGDYELAITDGSGCTVRDTVTVFAATDTPFAQAGDPLMVECGEMPQLDGSGSSPAPGPNVLYAWSASEGGEIISGGDTPRPFVSGPGKYELVVTTLSNGCSNMAMTTVTLSEQAAASISLNSGDCGVPVVATGNLPPGTSGVWTAFNDEGSVFTTEENVATVTEIGNGLSLVWTLSAGMGCEDYSADTIRVTEVEPILANDDLLELCGNDNIGQIDVKINDQRSGPVVVRLLGQPTFGEIAVNLNGDITFQAPIGINDITSIDYEICSVDCPTLCDTATLRLSSQDCGVDPVVYNAITPNGDGMNETFEFEILNLRPNDFPNNELIIFNRWGDILYEAAPYNNNWNGTNDDGTLVPEGTYYYILRLDIGQGDIIRGDVTVVR
ncbi:MAG: gliding motility-associated C-terminal domain-containing protein, partial [Bacteroidota bacterium]